MRNKDYREIQISSSMLIFIFMAVIVLGIVVFLLGVSVGKKQIQIAATTQYPTEPIEKVTEKEPVTPKTKDPIKNEIESHMQAQETQAEPAEEEKVKPKPAAVKPESPLFYIQVGAYSNRSNGQKMATQLKGLGYPAHIVEPSAAGGLFRVRVGGYESREKAEAVIETLASDQNKSNSDYFIVKE
jgi:cell division protein FtsN